MSNRAPTTLAVAFPSYSVRALTGALELGLAGELARASTRPARVTGVLDTVFARISGQETTTDRIRCLASGAREFLLQRAAGLFWRETGWFQAACEKCDSLFDLPTRLNNAPRKAAGDAFPVVTVRTSLGQRSFEAPNGVHEEHLAGSTDPDPVRALLAECGLSTGAARDAKAFSTDDLDRIEDALDAACPEIADEVSTVCPVCNAATTARIDPLDFAFPGTAALLREVHQIAAAYHWSEDAILALPSTRRIAYAGLIRSEARR